MCGCKICVNVCARLVDKSHSPVWPSVPNYQLHRGAWILRRASGAQISKNDGTRMEGSLYRRGSFGRWPSSFTVGSGTFVIMYDIYLVAHKCLNWFSECQCGWIWSHYVPVDDSKTRLSSGRLETNVRSRFLDSTTSIKFDVEWIVVFVSHIVF